MKIAFEVGHPAHVHLFKNVIKGLQHKGHQTEIMVRERGGIIGQLLKAYGFDYVMISERSPNMIGKMFKLVENDYKVTKITKKFKPDVFVSTTSPHSGFASRMRSKPHICFGDSEPSTLSIFITQPFLDAIITPYQFKSGLPKEKHVRVKSYKELSYLHPNNFVPEEDVSEILGIKSGERYVLLRFGAFDAHHDLDASGFTDNDKIRLVNELKPFARVFLMSELGVPKELKSHILEIPVEKIHSVLYHAALFVGDVQTSTTESAVLGTPAVRCNSFVGPNDMSNFIELEKDYGLIFNYRNPNEAIKKAKELLKKPDLKKEWVQKKEKLLADKIDLATFMLWFIEEWPESLRIMKENNEYQNRFGSGLE